MEDSLLNKYSSFTGTEFANVLCEKGLYRDAADWLLKVRAVKADPESLLRYAAVLRKISEPGKATPQELQAIRAAIAAASKLISEEASSDNYSLRAKAYLFAHQPDRALKDINKALLLENNYSNHDVKSRILIVKRSYRAALAELDRSWSDYTKEFDDPGDRDEFDGYERAAALFALDQDVAANTLLAKLAKKLSPGERFLIRGSVLADAGRREDSLLAFSQAKKLGKFENPLESLHF